MTITELKNAKREGDDRVIHFLDHKTADSNGVAKDVVSNTIYDILMTYACTIREEKLFVYSKGNAVTKLNEKIKMVYNIDVLQYKCEWLCKTRPYCP